MIPRNGNILMAPVFILAAIFAATAAAQNYPAKSVRTLVGFAAGSSTDVTLRLISPRLGEWLGQTVIVDNRAGAGGNIAAEVTAKAPADGYTLIFARSASIRGSAAGVPACTTTPGHDDNA